MHLGNGAITPECAVLTFGAAAVGLSAATVLQMHREPITRRKLALAAGVGMLVFAAQAINVPILPAVSAHLVGGVLLAFALGPGLGAGTMAAVLALQALLLGDGGLSALGANILNMALVPAACVYALRHTHSASVVSLTAGIAVVGASILIPLETALFRPWLELSHWPQFTASMIATHLVVAVFESGVTLGLILALDRVASGKMNPSGSRVVWASAAAGLVLIFIAFSGSSTLPDGYQAAARASGVAHVLGE